MNDYMNQTILQWKKIQNDLKKLIKVSSVAPWSKELDCYVQNLSDLSVPLDLKFIGGLDISFDKDNNNLACVCITVVNAGSNELVAKHCKVITMTEPYIVNYLAFRECEHMVDIVKQFLLLYPQYEPQVLLIDGNGTYHTNRFGSASHFGVRLEQEGIVIPTVGVAKNYLQLEGMPTRAALNATIKSMSSEGGEILHEVVDPDTGEPMCTIRRHPKRTKDFDKTQLGKLSFISPGHLISFTAAVNVVRLSSRCRMPEPILLADHHAKDFLIKLKKS